MFSLWGKHWPVAEHPGFCKVNIWLWHSTQVHGKRVAREEGGALLTVTAGPLGGTVQDADMTVLLAAASVVCE